MKNKKLLLGILAGVALLAVIIVVFSIKNSDKSKIIIDESVISGNISGIDMFTDEESSDMREFENKVSSNASFRQNLLFTLTYIESRAGELATISALAMDYLYDEEDENNAKMEESVKEVRSVANNTLLKTKLAVEAFTLMVNGEKGTRYEQFSSDAITSLLLIEKYNKTGYDFINFATKRINKEGLESNLHIAFIAEQWASYLAMESFLSNDMSKMQSWNKRAPILNMEQLRNGYKNCVSDQKRAFFVAQAMNSFIAPQYNDNTLRLKAFRNEDAVVGMHTICATMDQISKLFLNRTGWSVIVLDDKGEVSKVCIIDSDDILSKKIFKNENNLSVAVRNAEPFTIKNTLSYRQFVSSIEI
jgi:hypothetical protein